MDSTDAPAPRTPLDALVVGAGITGLVAAQRIARRGLKVAVVDAEPQPGGVIRTVRRDGFLFERGPNSALETTPLIAELAGELGLGAALRHASATSNKRYILRGGVPVAVPMSPGGFLSTPLFSAAAKLRLLGEPFIRAADAQAEESIAAFVRRRLGGEVLDYAIDPLVAGIYAGDPEAISVRAAFPKLHALEQRWGSMVRGGIFGARERRRARGGSKHKARSFSFAGGMQALTDALAQAAGGVTAGVRVTRFTRDADGLFTVHGEGAGGLQTWRTRRLLLAGAADRAAALLRGHADDAADALDAIGYAPIATVASAYTADAVAHPLDGFGCLVPRKERRRVLGVLFSSTMFEGRAPAETALLTTFVGGLRNAELAALPEAEIAKIAHEEHAALLGVSGPPIFQDVMRWPRAIPQYTIGHLGRVERALAATRALPGLHLAANWRGGISVGDCIANGHAEGEAIAAGLGAVA